MGVLTTVANVSRRSITLIVKAMLFPLVKGIAVASPFLSRLFQRLMTGEEEAAPAEEQ
jgi:hypothetical protein